ncbi:MAG: ABC transporter substrate-binding protein [Cyanobacteria bacterium SBLK]|nr:ABC transporter substrate-binding protein [Cyanobacteria bacterium SBLK]
MQKLAKKVKDRLRGHYFHFLILLFLLAFIIIQFLPNLLQPKRIEIALIAPTSSLYSDELLDGKEMINGVKLYFDRINARGGIRGKRLVLKVYDDRNDPEVAVEVAEEIAQSPAVAVLGHATSTTSLAAGAVYHQYGIPAVTATATADEVTDSQWYFRTIFSDSKQGEFIANYLNHIIGSKNVYLIYSDRSYGETLTRAMKKTFNSSNNPLIGEHKISHIKNIEKEAEKIVRELQKLKESDRDPSTILLIVQPFEAEKIVTKMRSNGLDYPIFGGDSLSNNFLERYFENTPQEQKIPGFFTNKIHAVTPLIFDIAEQQAHNFRIEFYRRYQYYPDWAAALYYDSAHAIVEAMQKISTQPDLPQNVFTGKNLNRDRNLVYQGLTQINSPDTEIQGISGNFYFDDRGETSIPILMGFFKNGLFISDFIQLSPIKNLDLVTNLEEMVKQGEIIKIGDRYLQKTNIVYTGIDINEINDIDEKNSSYLIDFYLWFKYKNKNLNPENIEFTNYDVDRLDSGERLTLGEPLEVKVTDGINHVIYQMKADFYNKFDFHNYPFDLQILSIGFQHYNITREQIIYVVDLVGTGDIPEDEVIKILNENQVLGNITDWSIKDITFYQSTDFDPSTLGYESLVNTNARFEYSQFNVAIEIQRDILSFSIKNLLPLWFFVLVAYSLMFLPFEDISVEAIGGILLAVVFYHLSLLDALPDGVGYVIALDYAFYLLYTLIGLQLCLVILGHSKRFQATGIKNYQLVQFGKFAFPVIWLIGCLIWYVIYAY